MSRTIFVFTLATFTCLAMNSQDIQAFGDDQGHHDKVFPLVSGETVTDTIFFHDFYNLPGIPILAYYNYSNGNGYFFGTNFMDLDQNSSTPLEDGSPSCAQCYKVSGPGYHIDKLLVRVGFKSKTSPAGTPLLLSINKMDAQNTYSVNTGSGSVSYTIDIPGTGLGSAAIPYDSIVAGFGEFYSVATLQQPVWVEDDYCVTADFVDFYLNGDRVGLFASTVNGANIYGKEYTLWHYPNPYLWIQVTHVYSSMTRAIAIFPLIDDGTASLEDAATVRGIKLSQNYPNPASGMTTVDYRISETARVSLSVLDLSGRTIRTHDQGVQPAGDYSALLDIGGLAPGEYIYTIEAGQRRLAKTLVVSR